MAELGGYRLRGLERLRRPDAFVRAAEVMASLPERDRYGRGELLVPGLLLRSAGRLQEYYAPHNEIASSRAKVLIAGLTPGWRQMEISLRTMRRALLDGRDAPEACRMAKREARFAGSMRRDLLAMLERLGLPGKLAEWEAAEQAARGPAGKPSPASGWLAGSPAGLDGHGAADELKERNPAAQPDLHGSPGEPFELLDHPLIHTTSVLPCPVFMDGANYSGHRPPLGRSPLLAEIAMGHMGTELSSVDKPLIIPLGRAVEDALRLLAADGRLSEAQVLWGFPHPSGANGSRHSQFEAALPGMLERIRDFKPDFAHQPHGMGAERSLLNLEEL
ncbi:MULTISPECIES: hypothetical protein [unclassified Paenibacillus]|uniref:hypothetical protein n=1 Tax=unclassified Paenibacillus TaxID=185978 RepID=UPI000956CBAF|nr:MULTISPECIES: hypothetical protein [unclassified Paenibacillus]ASS67435.1 hypothetical protein CIC07_15765 [Paenibacillus sp. RUD330]SIQ77099.1 hypothetical protein SAMN05880555_2277 [Paenibacillus sp. RU4X]SIQ98520.1 hypothetical protein SAMN05880570_2276 [Paenibacillus sp. RU4T]